MKTMEDPHEILQFYETPRREVVGISPVCKENIVPVLQDDIDKVRLEEIGELEMSIEETTITEHEPYSPAIPVGGLQKKKKQSKFDKTPLRYLANGKNACNIRGPLGSVTPSPNKPWRPFLLKSPQTSPVPQNNVFLQSPSISDNKLISNNESSMGDKAEKEKVDHLVLKKTSSLEVLTNQNIENDEKSGDLQMSELETIFNTSRDRPSMENDESNERLVQNKISEVKENESNSILETHNTPKLLDDLHSESSKGSNTSNGLNNHKMEEDPFISEIEREINKFCNVLKGSEISSPIKILSQCAGQVGVDKVTPNKNLNFNKVKESNVLVTCNRGIDSKSVESKSLLSVNENLSDDEIFPTKKKLRIETSQIFSTSQTKVLVNKENDSKYIQS